MQNPKKEDIIMQLGHEYIRIGLVGDKVPRKTIKSQNYLQYSDAMDPIKYELLLEELLYNIFFTYINSPCNNKTVIILEKVYTDRRVLEIITKIMFKKLKIDKIQMALSCVTPLYLTSKYTGIVVSAGSSCCEVMPIYQGFPFFKAYSHLNLGTNALNKYIRDDLSLLNPEISSEVIKQISEDEITEIKNQHGTINASNEVVNVICKKIRFKFIPSKINFKIFFGNFENQEPNLAYSFLNSINQMPISCVKEVCGNVVFAGGMWRVKGMQKYFKKNVVEQLVHFPRLKKLQIEQHLNFVSWGFNPSDISWIGCSIGSSIRSIDYLSLKRAEYNEHGFIEKMMECYFLSG